MSEQNQKAQFERLTEAAVEYCMDSAPSEREQHAAVLYCAPTSENSVLEPLVEKLAIKIRKVLHEKNEDPSELTALFTKQTGWSIKVSGVYHQFDAGVEDRAGVLAASVSEWVKAMHRADLMLFVSVDPELLPPEDIVDFGRALSDSLPQGQLLVVM